MFQVDCGEESKKLSQHPFNATITRFTSFLLPFFLHLMCWWCWVMLPRRSVQPTTHEISQANIIMMKSWLVLLIKLKAGEGSEILVENVQATKKVYIWRNASPGSQLATHVRWWCWGNASSFLVCIPGWLSLLLGFSWEEPGKENPNHSFLQFLNVNYTISTRAKTLLLPDGQQIRILHLSETHCMWCGLGIPGNA